MLLTPSVRKASSNGPEYLASRSRIRNPISSQPLPYRQVPGLLGYPRRVGVPGDAEEVHATGPELDGEQDVQRAKPNRLHSEEVEGNDPVSLGPEELAPGGAASARRRAEAFSAKDRPDSSGRYPDAELQQFAPDPLAAPPGILPPQPSDELHRLWIEQRPAGYPAPIRPLATDELPVPLEQCPRGHDEGPPLLPRQDPARRGEQHPVSPAKSGPANASLKHLELVSKDQQFGFQVIAI
jgi:hypothetical protein